MDTCRQIHKPHRHRKSSTLRCGALCSRYLFSRPVTRQLSSAYMCLTSVFGMGTGGPTWQSTRTLLDGFHHHICQMLSHLTPLHYSTVFLPCQHEIHAYFCEKTGKFQTMRHYNSYLTGFIPWKLNIDIYSAFMGVWQHWACLDQAFGLLVSVS